MQARVKKSKKRELGHIYIQKLKKDNEKIGARRSGSTSVKIIQEVKQSKGETMKSGVERTARLKKGSSHSFGSVIS